MADQSILISAVLPASPMPLFSLQVEHLLFISEVGEKDSVCGCTHKLCAIDPEILTPYLFWVIKVDEKVSVDPGYLNFASRNY